jgi:DNA-binding LytR/AlgR family response regulator
MIKFVLCDDNLDVLNKLSNMFESIFIQNDFNAEIAFKTTKSFELENYIINNTLDVLILDIQLASNLNGIDLANKVRKNNKNCYIIFTTAHPEYVFIAYQCKTFDFICKPITKERLEETVLRLFDDINSSHPTSKYIKLDNKNTFIRENEIQYIKKDGMKLVFHTPTRTYEMYSSFSKIQKNLPKNFIRCHKSFIANTNNIMKVESKKNLIYFDEKVTCDIGPKYKDNIVKGVNLYGNIS